VALTVRDIMETDVPSVYPEDPIEKVVRTMRDHELPGIPVMNQVPPTRATIITEADLVMREEQSDLHSRTSSSCGAA
jgi:predicted transcriptional regulator